MAAVITDFFKKSIVQDIIDGINDSSDTYYIGVGRSEYWDSADNPPTPVNNMKEIREFRQSLQAVKKILSTSFSVARVNWVSGTTYSQYDDTQVGHPSPNYYVLNQNHHVFICLRTGRDATGSTVPSTVEPTGSNNHPFETADGYVWKFLYTISALEANYFLSANYMPVRYIAGELDSDASGIKLKHKEIQDTAVGGMITSIVVEDGGSGYTSAPTVTITGNSTDSDFSVTAYIDSSTNTVAKIEFDNDSSTLNYPTGFDFAEVTISGGGGSGATARAVLSDHNGIGHDARSDLKANGLMLHTKTAGSLDDFIVLQDFRQIGIIKNPKKGNGSDSDLTAETANALKSMRIDPITLAFNSDNVIVGSTSGTKAWVDEVDSDILYYHQNDSTGYGFFTVGETLTESDGTGEGTIAQLIDSSEVDPFSGEVLYIDNRTAVARTTNQTEDIKIILQL
jgi:hypothetical protein